MPVILIGNRSHRTDSTLEFEPGNRAVHQRRVAGGGRRDPPRGGPGAAGPAGGRPDRAGSPAPAVPPLALVAARRLPARAGQRLRQLGRRQELPREPRLPRPRAATSSAGPPPPSGSASISPWPGSSSRPSTPRWGLDPRGYHLTSLALHAANAVALYALTLALLAPPRPAPIARTDPRRRRWPPPSSPSTPCAPSRWPGPPASPTSPAPSSPSSPSSPTSARPRAAAAARRGWLAASFALFVAALLSPRRGRRPAGGPADPRRLPAAGSASAAGAGRCAPPCGRRSRSSSPASPSWPWPSPLAARSLAAVPSRTAPRAAIAQACYAAWFYLAKTALPIGLAAVYPAPRAIDWLEPPLPGRHPRDGRR